MRRLMCTVVIICFIALLNVWCCTKEDEDTSADELRTLSEYVNSREYYEVNAQCRTCRHETNCNSRLEAPRRGHLDESSRQKNKRNRKKMETQRLPMFRTEQRRLKRSAIRNEDSKEKKYVVLFVVFIPLLLCQLTIYFATPSFWRKSASNDEPMTKSKVVTADRNKSEQEISALHNCQSITNACEDPGTTSTDLEKNQQASIIDGTTPCESISSESETTDEIPPQEEQQPSAEIAMLTRIEDLAQKFGVLDNKTRIKLLKLCNEKAKRQGNPCFDQDLKRALEEFQQEKISAEFKSYKDLCWEVLNRVPEDKWMRFVRLHLNLQEEEIQHFKRRFATFTDEQTHLITKTIRAGDIHPLMTDKKFLIGASFIEYAA